MKRIRIALFLIVALCNYIAANSQEKIIIRGRVIDKADKSTIIGANVVEYDKEERVVNGTTSNVNGDFALQLTSSSNKVRLSVIGYKTKEINIDPTKSIIVELESSDIAINEVTITAASRTSSGLTNIDDRDKASSHGLTVEQVQEAFYSAYGSRQVSTIYTASTFYYVILEVAPEFRQDPSSLAALYIKSARGELVPLTTVASIRQTVSPLTINHSGQIPSATISFNLKPDYAIGTAIDEINRFSHEHLPASVHTAFQGSAQAFQSSFASMGFLLLVTIIVIYMVLGILYESFIHPLTILSSLPLAAPTQRHSTRKQNITRSPRFAFIASSFPILPNKQAPMPDEWARGASILEVPD